MTNTTVSTMSSDANTAYSQGETAADNAYNETVNTLGMNSNSLPIVYDMEAFDPSNPSCLAAVKAFMRGWDTVLDAGTAQFPGYYGSVSASDPTAIYSISPRPSFVWGALADGKANTSLTPYVSDTIWPNTRLKQYGSGTLSAPGYSTAIDRDCANGPVYANLGISATC